MMKALKTLYEIQERHWLRSSTKC